MKNSKNIDCIVNYFLNLYRRQLGLENLNPDEMTFERLMKNPFEPEQIFSLHVKRGSQWATRRMSIIPLSEGAETKSACYKVAFDDLMVIKIPPEPITDFDDYLEIIWAEREMAEKLKPEMFCVTPSLTAILRKYPSFSAEGMNPDQLEFSYVSKLKSSSGLQSLLKIGGSFALFMNLSEHVFLDSIIGNMHAGDKLLREEMDKSTDALNDLYSFENRFGKDQEDLFLAVADLKTRFERRIIKVLAHHQIDKNEVPDFKIRQWFLNLLSGNPSEIIHSGFSDGFLKDQNRLISIMEQENRDILERFRQTAIMSVRKRKFSRNSSLARGIIINILKLLAILRIKDITIRDLKPDNMLAVGKTVNTAHFMNSPENYSLGLIDLETAVVLNSQKNQQPLLGEIGRAHV